MKKFIIHISHTDISRDSRIIKEINEIKNYFPQYKVLGIGIKKKNEISQNQIISFKKNLLNISLQSKKFFFYQNFLDIY